MGSFSTEYEKEDEEVCSELVKKRRGRKLTSSTRNHGMSTRNMKWKKGQVHSIQQAKKSHNNSWNLDVEIAKVVKSLGGSVLNKGLATDAEGASGGLLSLWNDQFFEGFACISNKNSIILAGRLISINKMVVMCNVCTTGMESERKILWDFIVNNQVFFQYLWVLGGDFNDVLLQSKRIGEGCCQSSIRNFNAFIREAKVVDIPLLGMSFTWSNFKEKAKWARLDRFLLSLEFLLWFPNLLQKGFRRSVSDHNAIDIVFWREFEGIETEVVNDGWSKNLRAAWLFTVLELWKGIHKEEQNWKQKSRVKWLKDGDRNSKFFNFLANDRKQKNFISDITFDGVVCSEPQDLRRGIVDFFKCHFEKMSWNRPSIEDINLTKLGVG
ncbi:hypothetical protein Ddye_018582 [Dipteronia dyeriana]|uniref:Endonuclease/exonuclease/phosphatase domain-containing protein n=1 Tax=Dipteronia dyeriana TaxID=168575 RepID=A0AAD9X1V0_9ROSI|nr:hypothetical protein Ddye_018582 [Dipteronia dyeriana]